MPFFSVIIPAYNRAHCIPAAIDSVLQQEFKDFELIVVDDGSTDTTAEVCAQFGNAIIYLKQENKGVCAARNTGAQQAKGEYLVFLDSDDHVRMHWLYDFYNCIHEFSYDVVFCDLQSHNLEKKSIEVINARKPFKGEDSKGIYIAGAFCIRKSFFEQAGGYDSHIRFGENTELSIRLHQLEPSIGFTNKVSLIYEFSGNGSSKNMQNKIDSNLYTLNKHPDYFEKNKQLKRLYLQSTGVTAIKAGYSELGKKLLLQAYQTNPFKAISLIRYFISFFPVIRKIVWKP